MSSDDYDSDADGDDEPNNKQLAAYIMKKTPKVITSYRYVHRLNPKVSLSKMKDDEDYEKYFLAQFAESSYDPKMFDIVIDDSDIDENDDADVVIENQSSGNHNAAEQETNLDDIRQKALEHNQQQIKGIHLANAGANNIKVVNNYSVTSSTCALM